MNIDNCQPEEASDVISGVVVLNILGMLELNLVAAPEAAVEAQIC